MDVHESEEPHRWVEDSTREWVDLLGDDVSATERRLWLLVAVVFVADVHLTYVGLQYGLTEGNPVMRWAISVGGIGALALAKGTVLGIAGLVRARLPHHGPVIALGVAAPWFAAALVNAATIA